MTERKNIDGFFRPRRTTPPRATNKRPGLDNIGQGPVSSQEAANWRPRHVHPTSQPREQRVSDFFHVPSDQAVAGAAVASDPIDGGAATTTGEKTWRDYLPKPTKKHVKRAGLIVLAITLIIAGYLFIKFLIASSQIFQGNAFNAIFAQGKELKMDENGRTNMLLFGTSEDDPNHPGAELTDSMMFVSIDQKKNKAFMVSIPRDLYVDYGMTCPAGYEGKINEVYLCAKGNNNGSEKAAQRALRKKVGEVFGVDMHYSAHVNYTALKRVVNAVDGITVTIDSDDPRGILDRNFDWKCNYNCYYVKHPNGPVKLDGKHALALARARGSVAPTYGLSGGNFEREKYQRKILVALKKKAASAGTLANPIKVSNLIDALGDNVRTNFDAAEIKTLADVAKETDPNSIKSINLVDSEKPLVTTGDVNGMSIVQPVAGLYEYSEIQAAVNAYATGNTAYFENATVDVLNASGVTGAAGEKADELAAEGVAVETIGNAPKDLDTAPVQLYDLSNGKKPGTLKQLEAMLGVEAIKGAPSGVTSSSDFVIIIGNDGVS